MKEYVRLTVEDGHPYLDPLYNQSPHISALEAYVMQVGTPDNWVEDLRKYRNGVYEIEYTTQIDNEGTWEQEIYVETLGDLILFKKSLAGELLFFYYNTIRPLLYSINCIFKKVWYVDFDYGCVGHSKGPNFIIKAMWLSLAYDKKELWSTKYTVRVRRGW